MICVYPVDRTGFTVYGKGDLSPLIAPVMIFLNVNTY